MHTRVFTISDPARQADDVRAAAEILRRGGLLGIPTETVYGLGADGLDAAAVRRIFEAKGRPQDNPLILHIPGAEDLPRYCEGIPAAAWDLAGAFWPGPLTMILPRRAAVPDEVTAGLPTVGVRCPDHPATLAVLRAAGVPVAAPSGNRSGRPSPTTAADMLEDMDGRIDGLVDGGPCRVGVESTIVDLTAPVPRLLRPGGLPAEELREALGGLEIDGAALRPLAAGERPLAPGMKYRHYAPRAPVTVVAGRADAAAAYIRAHAGAGDGVVCFAEYAESFPGCLAVSIGASSDLTEQARRVFAALRSFDRTEARAIYAQCPGDGGLGLAVANRLKRAAGFRVVDLSGEDGA